MFPSVPVNARARGRWRFILLQLGVPEEYLTGKNTPCILCGGRDRAHYSDYDKRGCYYCRQCFKGDGFQLLMRLHGWDFAQAARAVECILDKAPGFEPEKLETYHTDTAQPISPSQRDRVARLYDLANSPEVAASYLRGRGLSGGACGIRGISRWRYHDGQDYPALLSRLDDTEGQPAALHAIYLGPNGSSVGKKYLKGSVLPKGGSVRLKRPVGETLGIAEGVVTALSATQLFGLPTWAATSTSLLRVWRPPAGIKHVVVFADNDSHGAGQAIAHELATCLLKAGISVEVRIPHIIGDWNDVLVRENENAVRTA